MIYSVIVAGIMQSMSVLCFLLVMNLLLFIMLNNADQDIVIYYYIAIIFGISIMLMTYYAHDIKYGTPYYTAYMNDDQVFEMKALEMNKNNVWNFIEWKTTNIYLEYNLQYSLYLVVISALYSFGNFFDGYHTILPRLLNIYLIVYSMKLLEIIVKREYNLSKIPKKMLFSFMALFPSLYYIASFVFRDILAMFLIIASFCAGICYYKSIRTISSIFYLVTYGFASWLLFYVREFAAFVAIIIGLIYVMKKHIKKETHQTAILILLFGLLLSSQFIYFYFEKGLETFEYYSEYRISNESSLLSVFVNAPLLPFGVILRCIYGFITPLPSAGGLLSGDSIFYSCVYSLLGLGTAILLVMSLFALKRLKDRLTIVFMIVYTIFFVSLTFRHQVLYYPFLFLLIANGCESIHSNIAKKKLILQRIQLAVLLFVFLTGVNMITYWFLR